MRNAQAWKLSQECWKSVSIFCGRDGHSTAYLFPLTYSQKRLEKIVPEAKSLRDTPAFSVGALIPRIEALGRVFFENDVPVGIICLERDFERKLSDDEKEFVLAHEYSHIIMNHSPLLLMGNVASSIVNDYISGIEDWSAKIVLTVAWSHIQTAASLSFGRQSELDADAHAILVTGNRAAAVATIERLGLQFAGGLDNPSHYIVKGRSIIPVLTYRDRIDALSSL